MPVNKFYRDSFYIGADYHIDIGEAVNGVDQSFVGALFSGRLQSVTSATNTINLSFQYVDDFTIRASLTDTQTLSLVAGEYHVTIKVKYPDDNDVVLVNGIIEAKQTYS